MSIGTPDLSALAPEIAVAVGAMAVLVLDLLLPKQQRRYLVYLSLLTTVVAGWECAQLWGRSEYHLYNMLALDDYRLAVDAVILVGTALAILMSGSYLAREEMDRGEYYPLMLFAALGMMLMAGGLNLVVIFVGLETLSVSLYILCAFARGRIVSSEAGMKYLLIGSFATAFLLYGIVLVYAATGSTSLVGINQFLSKHSVVGNHMLFAGIGLLVVGFGFKVAAFPFHIWTPDVYEGAPTPVTAAMAVGVKAAAFAGFARVFISAFGPVQPLWQPILWWLAVLTMTLGNVVALAQTNIKRMLAYSSIAHAGYILIALVTNTPEAMSALIYYLLAYTLMTAGAFGVSILFSGKGDTGYSIYDYAGLGFRYPWIGAAMTVFMVSLAGFPPTAGFFAKFYLFSAAVQQGLTSIVVIAVINSVISVYYYFRVVVLMYMQRRDAEEPRITLKAYGPVGLAVGLAAAAVLLVGILPAGILELAKSSGMLALSLP